MRFGVKEVANFTFYNLASKKPELFLDTLKLSNLENNADQSFATGGQGGSKLVGWDFNRTATFNVQDALLNPKAISMQVGTPLTKSFEEIFMREVVTSVDNAGASEITLLQTPVSGSIYLYVSEDGYEQGTEIASADITVAGNKLTVSATKLPVGTQVLVYYRYLTTVEAEVITISSNKFSGYYMGIGDTFWRNEKSGLDEKVQIVLPKVKISSQFTLTMQADGDPSVFDFNLEVMKAPDSTDMVKLVRYQ